MKKSNFKKNEHHVKHKTKVFLISLISVLFFQTNLLYAEPNPNKSISGAVTDSKGDAIIGANVIVKGTSYGVVTDAEGKFSLDASADAILLISYIGYKSTSIAVKGQQKIKIVLEENSQQIDEIVVVGYGTQRKKDLTGAISLVDAKEIQKKNALTVAGAMQGLVPGVNVVNRGGVAGAEANILIRGVNNFSNNTPLYIIDGMPTVATRDFNMNDIESIQVLKDASAAAIYGSRAANGVIIITTKKGQDGPMKIDFSARNGFSTAPRHNMCSVDEWATLNKIAYDNSKESYMTWTEKPLYDSDWQDAVFRTAHTQDYNLTLSGGNSSGSYLLSGNYSRTNGVVIDNYIEKYNIRINTQGKKGIFSFGESFIAGNTFVDEAQGNPWMEALRMLPNIPLYDKENTGGFGYGSNEAMTYGTNPLAMQKLQVNTTQNNRLQGTVWMKIDFTSWLNYKLNLGYEQANANYIQLRKQGGMRYGDDDSQPSRLVEAMSNFNSQLVEQTLNFNKDFKKHHLDAILGYTYQCDNFRQLWGQKDKVLSSNGKYFPVMDAALDNDLVTGYSTKAILLSYLGRVNYAYANKYLLNFTMRRDGTSRLHKDHRWGNFPSIAGAWRISEERFFNVKWINDLKVRANYGILGSSNIGPWDYQPVISTALHTVMGKGQKEINGAAQVRLTNEELRWETLTQQNYGFDASMFNQKLSLSAEYYIATATDILAGIPIAETTGNAGGNPLVNAASMRNKGFELTVQYRDNIGDLKYSVAGNVSTIKNEILALGGGQQKIDATAHRSQVGRQLGELYLYQSDGIFQNEQEVKNHINSQGTIIQPNAKPGDIRIKDINDNGKIDDQDRAFSGDAWADFEYGLNLNFEYKNFDLTLQFYGVAGVDLLNVYNMVSDRFDDNSNYRSGIKPWTEENPNTTFPRISHGDPVGEPGQYSYNIMVDLDRWKESGNYLKLKDITLGYNVPKSLLQKIYIDNLRIYASAQNLITFTKYTGLDPEVVSDNMWMRSWNDQIPNIRTIVFGLQLSF